MHTTVVIDIETLQRIVWELEEHNREYSFVTGMNFINQLRALAGMEQVEITSTRAHLAESTYGK